jgi:hypothetical protein
VRRASHRANPGDAPGAATPVRRVTTVDRLLAVGAFAMFVILWVGFAIALRGDHAFLDTSWQWLRGLPVPIQVVVWLVFLPIAVGLWIWESTWPPIVGLLLAGGMVAWTLVAVDGLLRALRPARGDCAATGHSATGVTASSTSTPAWHRDRKRAMATRRGKCRSSPRSPD